MNEPILESFDDGLLIRDSGEWVENKLYFLSRYLHRFIVSMRKKPWRSINYIDLFSGPGKNRLPNGKILQGSPLIAINQRESFNKFFFSDINSENIEALKKRCETLPEYSQISFYTGDASKVVEDICELLEKEDQVYKPDTWTSLNLAFLDPCGMELHWQTVERLAKLRTDMIIYYSQMGITREAPKEINLQPGTPIDNFFGDTDWRNIYQECQARGGTLLHRRLLDHYKSKLASFGYEEVDDPLSDEPLFKNSKEAPLYRLIFVCKSKLGKKFWKDVISQTADGQMRLPLD